MWKKTKFMGKIVRFSDWELTCGHQSVYTYTQMVNYLFHSLAHDRRRVLLYISLFFSYLRDMRIWKYLANYFPVQLIKTAELDSNKTYLMGCHPHGLFRQDCSALTHHSFG